MSEEVLVTTETPELSEETKVDDSTETVEKDETTETKKPDDDLPEGVKKRFSKLTAEKYRSKAIIEQQNQKIQELTDYLRSVSTQEEQVPDINAFVEKRAHEIISEQDFNSKCNETFSKWTKEYGDVSEAMEDLGAVGLQRDVLEAIVESSESYRILQYLSNDLERADKLSKMKPIKAAKELDKIEEEVKALAVKKSKVSAVPAPISDVSGKNKGAVNPADMTDEEYAKWRRTK